MTIQKPDFNQIFASQAPDVDKPPVFNNYNGGMGDEYRPNNGRPTIKGFNYIQQLNDNKFLWMAQNGAFPYDTNIEYAVGVVTIKDGRFKQWDGTDWINFGQDDGALKTLNNLSDLTNKTEAIANLGIGNASTTTQGLVKLVDDLTTGGTDKAITAEAIKIFYAMFNNSLGQNGRIYLPNPANPSKPVILQWSGGSITVNANTATGFIKTFDVSFPTECFSVICKNKNILGADITSEAWDKDRFSGFARHIDATTIQYTFWAIGY